jgi:signal transduction histidine kinase
MDNATHHRQDDYLIALEQFNAEAHKIDDIGRLWATVIARISGFLQVAPVCLFLPFSSGGEFRLAYCTDPGPLPEPSAFGFKPAGVFIQWFKNHDTLLSWEEISHGVFSPGLSQDEQQLLAEIKASVSFGVKDAIGELSGVIMIKPRSNTVPYTASEIRCVALMVALLSPQLERILLKQAFQTIQAQIQIVREQFALVESLDETTRVFREITHSFNNILTGIIGRSELALGEKEEEKIKRHVLRLEKAASGAQDRAHELRDLAEFTAGQVSKLTDLKPKEALNQIEHLLNTIYPGVDAVEERDGFERNKNPGGG